jgi:hypothetical protein
MNHGWGGIINPKRPVAADANGLILLPLSEHSGHGRTCYWFAPVANDPERTSAVVEANHCPRLFT